MSPKNKKVVGGIVVAGLALAGVAVSLLGPGQTTPEQTQTNEEQIHPPSRDADTGETVGLGPNSGAGLGI